MDTNDKTMKNEIHRLAGCIPVLNEMTNSVTWMHNTDHI